MQHHIQIRTSKDEDRAASPRLRNGFNARFAVCSMKTEIMPSFTKIAHSLLFSLHSAANDEQDQAGFACDHIPGIPREDNGATHDARGMDVGIQAGAGGVLTGLTHGEPHSQALMAQEIAGRCREGASHLGTVAAETDIASAVSPGEDRDDDGGAVTSLEYLQSVSKAPTVVLGCGGGGENMEHLRLQWQLGVDRQLALMQVAGGG